jgi:hypothetical protein
MVTISLVLTSAFDTYNWQSDSNLGRWAMKRLRKRRRPVSVFLTILVLSLVLPYQPVLAAMVGTETVMEQEHGKEARDYLKKVIAREDVRAALVAQGIDPQEAKARVDSLSDAEAVCAAKQIEGLPAGGVTFVEIFGIAVVVALVIVIILFVAGVLKWDKIH